MIQARLPFNTNFTAEYKQFLLNTEQSLKQIMNAKSHMTQEMQSSMCRDLSYILQYMCQQGAYQKQLYARSMILIDNIVTLTTKIDSLLKSKKFAENIRHSFERVTQQIRQKKNIEKHLNLLYAHLYIILYLIKISQEHKEVCAYLQADVFKSSFLEAFLQLPFSGLQQNFIRVSSMIFAHLANKPIFKVLYSPLLQATICRLCLNCNDQVAKSYLVIALFQMKAELYKQQIIKNNVLKMLVSALENVSAREIQKILIIICSILENNSQLAEDLMNTNFLKLWQYRFTAFPDISLKILEIILPIMNKSFIENWLRLYINLISTNKCKVTKLELTVCNHLFRNVIPNTCLLFIEEGILSLFYDNWSEQLQQIVDQCKISFMQNLNKADPNLMGAYKNFLEKDLVETLKQLW